MSFPHNKVDWYEISRRTTLTSRIHSEDETVNWWGLKVSVCNGRKFSALYRDTLPSKQRPIQARSVGYREASPYTSNMSLIAIVKPQDGELWGTRACCLSLKARKRFLQRSLAKIQARVQRGYWKLQSHNLRPASCCRQRTKDAKKN